MLVIPVNFDQYMNLYTSCSFGIAIVLLVIGVIYGVYCCIRRKK